jgi:hypothetical protein
VGTGAIFPPSAGTHVVFGRAFQKLPSVFALQEGAINMTKPLSEMTLEELWQLFPI